MCVLAIPVVYRFTVGANPAVGTWAYTVQTPAGPLSQTLALDADMSGTIPVTEPATASYPKSNAIVDGQSLSFVVETGPAEQEIKFSLHGTVEGDSISGEYVSVFGNSKVTGTRK
ncbi:MAG TPA: hypothetical protein EYN96_02125 [Candidatus Hydrogenedentes bacterium]|nr:hypothetical protein [Candidatus Hydrogenedentota bacterium]